MNVSSVWKLAKDYGTILMLKIADKLLVTVVKDIHASGLLIDKFGKEIPILIHELEYYDSIATQNIEASGAAPVKDFVSFCQQDDMPGENGRISAKKRSTSVPQRKSWEPTKKAADMRTVMMFLIALVFTMGLIACLNFLYLYNRDTAVDRQDFGGAQQEKDVDQTGEEKEELSAPATAVPDAASDIYRLTDDGMDTGVETEIVEKNAKNTGELRISTSITKLWLNEDEEGAAEINAALREIYKAAEAEMEAYNQEILDEYLFEDGALQEDLDEWLLYPLDEWLAISTENYVASIEYVDENYLCLSMNGDNFVAGGAHGSYWSDYYVFDRHTGQRLSLEDFVNDSAEEIKEIVKAHILAVAPYSKGEQSEDALEQNRFFLTAEGLGIHYDEYELGDYASGSCDLIIPFELFDMKEDMWPGTTTKSRCEDTNIIESK